MTDTLVGKSDAPCKGYSAAHAQVTERFHGQVPQWEVRDDAKRVERTGRFGKLRAALTFLPQIGELAESEGHRSTSALAGAT